MKTKNLLSSMLPLMMAAVLCGGVSSCSSDDVAISESEFPDENFRNYLLEQDYGKDGVITEEEVLSITKIDVSIGGISSLKGIEYFTALKNLDCSGNQLTSLDVSKNTALTWLECDDNPLTSLDVSKNTALTGLRCSNNRLTSLDVSKNTALTHLDCDNNPLTSLDVSKNTALKYLYCYENQIKGKAMDALISSLPQTSYGDFRVYYPSSTEGNVCTKSQVAAAKAKGWTSYYYSGNEYEGSDE